MRHIAWLANRLRKVIVARPIKAQTKTSPIRIQKINSVGHAPSAKGEEKHPARAHDKRRGVLEQTNSIYREKKDEKGETKQGERERVVVRPRG